MRNQGFERILLATDGSDQAKAAEAVATSFARAGDAAIRVVHVWNMEVRHKYGHWYVETRRGADTLIRESVSRMRAAGADADGELIHADNDHIASALTDSARRFRANLVVVGARGLSDLQSMFLGSVSHEVLGTLDCPVLVVRGAVDAVADEAKRVLLAIAGGDDVVPAVRAAIAAASSPGSRVLIMHVAQALFGAYGFAYVEPENEISATIRSATAMLQEAGIQTEAYVAQGGQVAKILAETAARWEADVTVIGSSRMGDLASLVFGSVTHQLLRGAGPPVLVAQKVSA